MASSPTFTILQESQVSPPPATVDSASLALTFFDSIHLLRSPIHYLFFYELPLITKTQFLETIAPNLEQSLSITLQHFFPFAGNLIVFNTSTKLPEKSYSEGDSVKVTFGECNLDFNDLTGYHPRNCDKFYHLIPRLGQHVKLPDYVKIPVFSLQVTLFQNRGISFGMSSHHSLADASTQFSFLEAWTSIARHGTDESFLANGTLPLYERYPPTPDEFNLNRIEVESFLKKEYQPVYLSGPTNKVRATFVLTRTIIDQLKKRVLAKLPNLTRVSSLTIACGYIWYCIAKSRNDDLHAFALPIDCRTRLDPPVPGAYFGNCVLASVATETTSVLSGDDGFLTAVKSIGENLHKMLTDKDGVVEHRTRHINAFSSKGFGPQKMLFTSVSGSPKLKLYDLDFGWGKPKKIETISIDYASAISVDSCKDSKEDLEIGVCLTDTGMQAFARIFNEELEHLVVNLQ